ncbi:CYTH domain-containing protein [Roseibium marinum]|uniref:CYTH domain-containing protein n=1 Tax=Roseibium marinum TaxID=281252 RepID=A0A2S3UM47_9HYPH|nr:CYTH domain-containing protein [Roseibium marinum]POF28640.1 CYTH domain-containing protein [Roseibium marinum]
MNTITSREYKLILNSGRFQDRNAGSEAFQDLIDFLAGQLGGEIKRQQKEEMRRTTYLDTQDFELRRAGYALRLRHEKDDDDYKLTLKFRSPDLILAEDASVETTDDRRAEMKFEEDLMPPFRSVFSRSSAIRFKKEPELSTVHDATGIFPALKRLGLAEKTKLLTVNGFRPAEIFRKLCKVDFRKADPIKLGLSFWYAGNTDYWPLIAECAFDFEWDPARERFDLDQVRRANELFRVLQKQPGWFDAEATTKTRYAYEGLF